MKDTKPSKIIFTVILEAAILNKLCFKDEFGVNEKDYFELSSTRTLILQSLQVRVLIKKNIPFR